MFRTILGLTLLGTAALPAQAAVHNAINMSAVSGSFTPYDSLTNTFFPSNYWTNTQNPTANLVGGYVSLGAVATFYGLPMYLYTSDGISSPFGGGSWAPYGGPVPNAILDDAAHTIQADLSALTWFWNFNNFGQGIVNASGTWNPSTGVYHLAWNAPFTDGYGFDGMIGQWTMTGVAVVPEPETYAQMLAALALLAPLLRRRRSS